MNFHSDLMTWITHYTGLNDLSQIKLFKTLIAGVILSLILFGIHRIIAWRVTNDQRRYIANKTAGYAVGLIFTLSIWRIWLGGGLAAYIGILSAGLAIALKDPITNLAGWLFISIRKPFAVGDRIEINNTQGRCDRPASLCLFAR